jgi:ATP synthase protein I
LTLFKRLYRFRAILRSRREPPPPERDEALKRLDERIDAMAASTVRKARPVEAGAEAGYKVVGELFGGILGGLGLGWTLDRFAGTTPWGLIGGVVIGMTASILLIVRSAERTQKTRPVAAQSDPDEPRQDE